MNNQKEITPLFTASTDVETIGYTMSFPNGVTVSVRWGTRNYSDGKTNAEVAAWTTKGPQLLNDWVLVPGFHYEGDTVLSGVDPTEVVDFMATACKIDPKDFLASILYDDFSSRVQEDEDHTGDGNSEYDMYNN